MCVCVAMLQSLRYPLLLSMGAVRLVVPRGRRWHQNPQSHSEKVTKIQEFHPHLYSSTHSLLVTHSSGRALPGLLVPHQFSQSFALMFYVHKREQTRNVFEMSNGLTGSSVMNFWKELLNAALEATTDGIGAFLLQWWDRKQEGKDAHTESCIKNEALIN